MARIDDLQNDLTELIAVCKRVIESADDYGAPRMLRKELADLQRAIDAIEEETE